MHATSPHSPCALQHIWNLGPEAGRVLWLEGIPSRTWCCSAGLYWCCVRTGGSWRAGEDRWVGIATPHRSAKPVIGFACDDTRLQEICQVTVEGDLSEADNDSDFRGRLSIFGGEIAAAVANLLRGGLIAGWGAADNRGYPSGAWRSTSPSSRETHSLRLVGEGEPVRCRPGLHEVVFVACEGTSGAVGSMGSGQKAKDQDGGRMDLRSRGRGRGPVGLVLIVRDGESRPMSLQYLRGGVGEALAGDDGLANLLESGQSQIGRWIGNTPSHDSGMCRCWRFLPLSHAGSVECHSKNEIRD